MRPFSFLEKLFVTPEKDSKTNLPPVKLPRQVLFSQEEVTKNQVFHSDSALEINKSRIRHLESLKINWQPYSLLDMGCGVGYFSDYFSSQGCRVHFADARINNVEEAKRRIPNATPHLFNIEKDKIETLGFFDVVFCYGLLYHLENPLNAITKMSQICKQMLLIETIVSDHDLPLNQLVLESPHSNQALNGIGSRPSPAYIVFSLRNAGWRWIYTAKNPPDHPDFHFDWKNNLEYSRHGKNLRCFFLASRSALNNPELKLLTSV